MRAPRSLSLLIVGVLAALGLALPAAVAEAATTPLVITTTQVPDGLVGTPYATALKATGGNLGRVWKLESGSLPAGMKLNAFGRLSGTPTTDGDVSFTVSVHDTASPQHIATAVIDLTIKPMYVSTTSLPDSHEGKAYSAQLKAAGGTKPYTWSLVEGSLPPGSFTLSSSGKITGAQAFFTGDSTFTVQAKDKAGRTAVQVLTLHTTYMAITTSSLPLAKVGKFYSAKIKHSDGCTSPKWEVIYGSTTPAYPDPLLPAGLTINRSSGVISGIPKAAWSHTIRVVAQCNPANIFAPYAARDLTLTVA